MRAGNHGISGRGGSIREFSGVYYDHEKGNWNGVTGRSARGKLMKTLAIDIGGTKFSMAIFDGDEMIERESRPTDREGGRDWMMEQIGSIASRWASHAPGRCGIGFGGP